MSKQVQGLHLLSEAAMSNGSSPSMAPHHPPVTGMGTTAPPLSSAAVTRPLISHTPHSGWYQPARAHGGEEMMIDPLYGYQAQFAGMDFGNTNMGSVDGAINGLFLESGPLWPMQNIPETFLGGWPG
jgi:hypothetical protein